LQVPGPLRAQVGVVGKARPRRRDQRRQFIVTVLALLGERRSGNRRSSRAAYVVAAAVMRARSATARRPAGKRSIGSSMSASTAA